MALTTDPTPDIRPVARVIGIQLCGLGAVMLLPAAIDAAWRNPDWVVFAEASVVTGFVGLVTISITWSRGSLTLDRKQAFLLTTLSWLVIPAFGALPFLGLGIDYSDAFFESVSGITTTGSTVLTGLDLAPPGILLWRSLLQWVGGVGIIVMAIVMLPFLRIGGMQLFHAESSDRSETVVPGAFRLAAWITTIYATLTLTCAVLYAVAGMTIFDALCHAMTTLSTGGFSTHDASVGYFASPTIEWLGVVFMLSGALPFVAYIKLIKGERRALSRDPQVRALIGLLLATTVLMSGWLVVLRDVEPLDALRLSSFNITSVVTTTGYASTDYNAWGGLALGLFLLLTFVGGCTGSTSGAIKIFRFRVLWLVVRTQVMRLSSPRRVLPLVYAGRVLPPDVPASVLAFIAVFLGTVALFTVALTGMGLDLLTALTSSATAIANVGPGLGPIVGPAGNFASLPDPAKWLLSLAMLLGRLELFTVLVLLHPGFWRA